MVRAHPTVPSRSIHNLLSKDVLQNRYGPVEGKHPPGTKKFHKYKLWHRNCF